MIRYLTQEEKTNSRGLWEEAFPEDSRAFDDYYFDWKLRDNRILVMEQDGEIVSMLHQNPYLLSVGGQRRQVDYLVGVATRETMRHRGCMRRLLQTMMETMWDEEMPFCFLMPAAEAIYRPFGFTYIFDQPRWKLTEEAKTRVTRIPFAESGLSAGELAAWMQQWLETRYRVFAVRDEVYAARLLAELASENGTMDLLYLGDRLAGIQSEWGLEKRESRLLMADGPLTEAAKPDSPAIMARIIHLESFMRHICLRESGPETALGPLALSALSEGKGAQCTIMLAVEDPLLPENHGLWRWTLGRDGSELTRLSDRDAGDAWGAWDEGAPGKLPQLRLSIDQLTGWLFGYQTPECASAWDGLVQKLAPAFLDEVV